MARVGPWMVGAGYKGDKWDAAERVATFAKPRPGSRDAFHCVPDFPLEGVHPLKHWTPAGPGTSRFRSRMGSLRPVSGSGWQDGLGADATLIHALRR